MGAVLDGVMQRSRAWAVALVALLLGLLAIGLLGEAERDASPTEALPEGYSSTEVVALEQSQSGDEESTAVVLFSAEDGLGSEELAQLEALFGRIAPAADVAPGRPVLVPSEDGTAAVGVTTIDAVGATEVAEEVTELREQLRQDVPAGVTAQVTGPAAVQADLAAVFDGANVRLLAATAAVVAILLVITYRSPVLWLVPLVVVGIADRAAVALATHVLQLVGVAWDESTVGILSVLVFGAGTDYALLLISRYRDELRVVEDRYVAMRRAVGRTAEAVLASTTTIVLGLLTLLLSLFPTTRGLGLACAVGVVVAAVAALGALPFTLVLFGRWVFWPKVPRTGDATLVEAPSVWRRVGSLVDRRPGTLVLVSVAALAVLASGATQIETGLSEADQFLEQPEAIAAAERLAESFPAGSADPTTVLAPAPDADDVSAALEGVDGVSSVRPGTEGGAPTGGLARIDVVLEAGPGTPAAAAAVEGVREAVAAFPGTEVGGTEAQAVDEQDAAARDRLLLIPLILGLVVVALVVLLRSLVAPLILVASVAGTYLSALGASWWLFTGVLGFDRLDVGVPLLAFLFLVALGVDYNIFLVTRAAEEARGRGAREGMLRALTATGGVITSAGIVLAAVFAVLGVLPLVVLAQLGVVICIGVLLDTLVVRTLLVPALAVRLGDGFWWPRRFLTSPDADHHP